MGFEEIYDILIGIIIFLCLCGCIYFGWGCLHNKIHKSHNHQKFSNQLDDENPQFQLPNQEKVQKRPKKFQNKQNIEYPEKKPLIETNNSMESNQDQILITNQSISQSTELERPKKQNIEYPDKKPLIEANNSMESNQYQILITNQSISQSTELERPKKQNIEYPDKKPLIEANNSMESNQDQILITNQSISQSTELERPKKQNIEYPDKKPLIEANNSMESNQYQILITNQSISQSTELERPKKQNIEYPEKKPLIEANNSMESNQDQILITNQSISQSTELERPKKQNIEYPDKKPLIEANNSMELNQDRILLTNQSSEKKQNTNHREQLDLLIKNNRKIKRCQIDPICEFAWIFNSVGSELIDQLIKCVYCNLEMEEQFVTSCGCTYHDDCLQKHINQSQGNPSIKCARCTKPIHKGLAKYGNLKEEQKNQLFDNQLAIIKQQNKCQSGYFKCQICGRLYNQDECGCQKIDFLV